MKRLLCVVIEAGAADYMTPVVDGWRRYSPPFDWRLATGAPAARVLAESPCNCLERSETDTGALDHEPIDALVISAGGWPAEHALVLAARSRGIPTLQFVDSWYGYGRRLTDRGRWVLPDRLLVIDERAAQEAVAEGVPAAILATVGHPGWETVGRLPKTQSTNLLFLGAPVARDYGRSLGYTEAEAWEMMRATARARPDLVGDVYYAHHPEQCRNGDFAGARLVPYDRSILQRVGTVVGMFSAPLLDAHLAGRRVITLQPGAKGFDMCPLSRHGRIPRTTTEAALIEALSASPGGAGDLADALAGSADRINGEVIRLLGE